MTTPTPDIDGASRSKTHAPDFEVALDVLSDPWVWRIMRSVLVERVEPFSALEKRLGISTAVLTRRLDALLAAGLLCQREYRLEASRPRLGYHPTPVTQGLQEIIDALERYGASLRRARE